MKPWKIILSLILGFSISFYLFSIVLFQPSSGTSATQIDTTVFYQGVAIIVLAIIMLCAVIIVCTSNIIKAIESKK